MSTNNVINHRLIKLSDYLIPLDNFKNKTTIDITGHEILSLLVHSIASLSEKYKNKENSANNDILKQCSDIYNGFLMELGRQNDIVWPDITVTWDSEYLHWKVLSISKLYLKSSNVLTHVLRLLIIEIEKHKQHIYANQHIILQKNIAHFDQEVNNKLVKHLNMQEIIELTEIFIDYYAKVYHINLTPKKYLISFLKNNRAHNSFEYLLAKTILAKI